MSGIYHVEISRADADHLRIELTVGEFPDNVSAGLGRDPEGVQLSVLVKSPANPPLLDVQLAALRRAEHLIQGEIASVRAAAEGRGS